MEAVLYVVPFVYIVYKTAILIDHDMTFYLTFICFEYKKQQITLDMTEYLCLSPPRSSADLSPCWSEGTL